MTSVKEMVKEVINMNITSNTTSPPTTISSWLPHNLLSFTLIELTTYDQIFSQHHP